MDEVYRHNRKKTAMFLLLSFVASCELTAAPSRTASRQHHTHKAGKSHIEEWVNSIIHKERLLLRGAKEKYLPSKRPCRRRILIIATLAELNLGPFIAPQSPITWAYCDGSCDPPYSIDVRNRNYITSDDVLLRQMADLTNIAIPDRKKKKFKKSCCVPVQYTGMRLATMRKGKVTWEFWRNAIPSRCGCR